MAFMPQDDEPEEDKLGSELPEDNGTPYSPPVQPDDPDDVGQSGSAPVLDDTHPVTDSSVEGEEVYDEDLPGAAEASEPNADNAVTGYNPDEDQRKQDEA